MIHISVLVGKTLKGVEHNSGMDEIYFDLGDGLQLVMGHHQDCCESVYIEDIYGDLEDLVGTPILVAEERTSQDVTLYGESDRGYDDVLWTFYEIRTIKGSVTIRWCGESNGYYSVSVDTWWKNA